MVLIVNEGHLLTQKRSGTGAWSVSGRFLESGEWLEGAERREASEETGRSLSAPALAGICSGPDNCLTPDGDEYNVTVACPARDFSGTLAADGAEGTEVVFTPSPLPELLGPPARPVLTDLTLHSILKS